MKSPKEEISCPPCEYFSRGAKVEVRDEQGAWFPAHVLDPNPNQSPFSLRNRNRKQKLLVVEYETLVSDDDPSKPLTEEIEVGMLRPSPPAEEEEEGFEANDVVDAFNLDAWWPGVVMSVVGDKYTVGFKSPPDLLELGRGELRRHWDWCGGEWTRAGKEMMMRLDFSPGEDVEVNLHRERVWYAWIPAIYVGPLGGNSFLVRYKGANNGHENGFVKVVSDYQIRPLPPQQEERAFELLGMVDAYLDMCWWVGDITKVLTGERYVVTLRFTKQEKEFRSSDLRHHSEWIGSKWVSDPKALENSIVNEERLRYARSNYRKSEEKTPCHTKSQMKQLTCLVKKSPYGNTIKKLKLSELSIDGATFSSSTPSKKLKGKRSEDSLSLSALFGRAKSVKTSNRKGPFEDGEKSEQQLVGQLDGEVTTPVKRRVGQRKSQADSPSPGVRQGTKARRPKLHVKKRSGIDKAYEQNLEDEHVINGIESSGIGSENEIMGGSKAGSSCLLPMEDNQQHNEDGASSGIKLKRKLPMLVVEHSKDPTTGSGDSVRDGRAVASVEKVKLAVSGIPAKKLDHDQSLFIKEGNSVKTVEGSISGRKIETGVKGDVAQQDSPNLPFVKSIPLWENIESMEVFKRFPQKPHFHPVLKSKEVFREGSAFGKMLAFRTLVDWTSKIRIGDPRNVIDSNLEATVELELHGFDVDAIKCRLTGLLDLKAKLEELQNQSKVVETKITACRQNTIKDTETICRIDKEIKDLEANIKGLKKKRAMAVSMCSAKDSELSKLQSEAKVISEGIQSIQHGFDILAAAPL
ncbi:putative Agenet-like domain-containing protein [Rosa chinensis]|uniref:Putative Agenet-like domain-containing protein n=1 Tax=Rosa chinensis TaxID=74649 RepID=A0A2P6SM11_ROSCH|nr:DUF724 domain-containing protein 7 isoform X2 [Rosa chinensis]PRQ59700.1 putative Agenet-like domain-containing protein [Rosa chinensis]